MSTEREPQGVPGHQGAHAEETSERCGPNGFLLAMADAIRPKADAEEIQAEAARRLGMHLRASRAFYAEVDECGNASFASDYCSAGMQPIAGRYRLDDFGTAFADSLREGRVLAVADIESLDTLTEAERQRCRNFEIRALLKVPLVKNGQLGAFLALHQSAPREWSDADIALTVDVADRTWAVAERSKAERGLRQSEEKYRALFDAVDDGLCIMEVEQGAASEITDLHFREVNQAFEQQSGLHDAAGKRASEFMPHYEPHWKYAIAEALRTGRTVHIENYQSDTGRWYRAQYSRIGGEGSRLLAAVFADVTERKRIAFADRRLAAIVESSDDAIISKDLDGIIETWNAGAGRIFGYARDEVIGKSITILMPPDRVDEEPGILARLRRGERVDHYETVRQRKDGSLLDVSLIISPILDAYGKVVAASKIARDISLRKRTEAALRESDQRHGFLLMLADALREQHDPDAIAAVCTRMLAGFLGVDRCYIAQLSLRDNLARMVKEYHVEGLRKAYGADGALSLAAFRACVERLETGSLAVNDIAVEPGMSDAERSALRSLQGHAALIAAPLRVGGQDVIWTLVVGSSTARAWTSGEMRLVEDVAERAWSAIDRAKKDTALREREAEVRRVSHAKDEFIAMLGHELRNPLAPIATTLQLMKLRAPGVMTRERGVIEAQVQHLTGLVDDLLDVTRIASGKVELKSERVEVEGIIAAAVESTQDAMESNRQTLHVQAEEGLAVSGDRRRLVQVLVNLLGNAAKYSPPDRNIWLSARAEDGQLVLCVHDEGRGVARDLLTRIFDSFTQDSRGIDRSQGGLGLGLSIVRSLVLLHGGSVSAESEGPYKGSEFTVRLPLLDRPQPSAALAEKAHARAVPHVARPDRIKVLIVDDYAPAAESLSLLLHEMGYHTHVVPDGAAGLAALATFHPQIALVDIGLPVIDGYEVAQTVRRTPGFERLPLVAITGYGQASDHARVMDAGFDEHLVKPLDAARISELIDRLVAEA